MRSKLLACLLMIVPACQRADSAERSAAIVAKTPAPPLPAVAAQPVAAPAPTLTAHADGAEHSCGGGCGAEGGGCQMGPQGCTGGVAELPTWKALPTDATWTDLHVTGMHCGGCARRIEKRLASVDGVLGVKIDVTEARVAIATKPGIDARALAKPAIDAIGYHVD